MKATFNIGYFSKKDKGFIIRSGTTTPLTREGINKKTKEKYFVYYDLEKMGYRTATGDYKIWGVA